MSDVFLSYAHGDQETAERIENALSAAGISVFWDRDVRPGESWEDTLVHAIASCRVFVAVFSERANVSPYVAREVELAVNRGLTIIPYRIGGVRPTARLEYFISRYLWIDGDSDEGLERLVRVVQRALGELGASSLIAPEKPSWLLVIKELLSGKFPSSTSSLDARQARIASNLTDALMVHRLEDIGKPSVLASMRPELEVLGRDLPERLERVSRQADQITHLQAAGRQIDAAESALRILSGLKSELVTKSGALAAAASQIVDNWSGLFSDFRDAALARIEEEREVENPFIFGNPVRAADAALFTGRRDIVLEIERSLVRAAQAPTLLLYGQRRMGKTSILNQLPNLLGPGFLPVLVDCQAPATVESQATLLRHLSRYLGGALNSRLGISRSDEGARRVRGAVDLSIDDLKSGAYSVFEDWLDTYESRLPTNVRVLICLDEFERLSEIVSTPWGIRFLDALRHWLQHRPQFALMFVGSHTFEQLGPTWTDRFISARRLKVSFLDREDVRQLLTRPTATFNLKYAPGALESIQNETNGQPFLTQALASELVHFMNRERRKEATTRDVTAAIADTLERSGEYFADVWFSRSEEERDILRQVAKGKKRAPTSGVARDLFDYDLLNAQGDFAVPIVGRWVRKHHATDLNRAV